MISGKVLGEKYTINGKLADVAGFTPDMSADIYYEVIRLMDGKYLFLPDHLARLENSLSGSGIDYPGPQIIMQNLKLLQENNSFTLGNIRICIQSSQKSEASLLCYFVPYFYPEVCMYKSGVQVATYPHIRLNPGVKKWDDRFRVSVNEFIRVHGVYEAILMNNRKEITEGSRSNIFFFDRHNHLITAPESDILPGITRKYVLKICADVEIEVSERAIHMGEIREMSSCFISGTSPKILPVWQLDGIGYNADHPQLRLLMERFELIISENLTMLN